MGIKAQYFSFSKPVPRKQAGTVLISVIMMVSLAALIATDISYRQKLDIKRTSALLSRDQAMHYLMGAESLARWALQKDLTDDLDPNNPNAVMKDTLHDIWVDEFGPFPVNGGFIKGRVTDLQSRLININDLADPASSQIAQARLMQLMMLKKVPKDGSPKDLIDPLVDWLDPDQEPTGFSGKEDIDYLSADPPHRSANQIIFDLSEMLVVEGFTPEVLKAIGPYLSFLPPGTPLNVNTVDANMSMVFAPNQQFDVGSFIQKREEKDDNGKTGFDNTSDAMAAATQGRKPTTPSSGSTSGSPNNTTGNTQSGNFSIDSEYYLLEAEAIINDKTVIMHSILYRPKAQQGTKPKDVKVKTVLRKLESPF